MIHESITSVENESEINPLNNKVLTFLALATSIDALAVGVSFAFLNVSILFSIFCIGLTTFVLSLIGILIGKLSGERLKKKAGLFGGIVLMLLGLKILLEHLNILFN
jgi:manganese efflux pump family protein